MKTHSTCATRDGFTLIELLVVIAIIAILASMLYPSIHEAIVRSHMIETLNNGRSVHQAMLSAEMDRQTVRPKSSGSFAFATSTEYFRWLITNNVLDASFHIFSAYGLPSYAGLDASRFSSTQNAWCVTADIDDATRSLTPVLFTKNLNLARLSDPADTGLTDDVPYGTRGVIVVAKDNSANTRRREELHDYFNPAGETNLVLRP